VDLGIDQIPPIELLSDDFVESGRPCAACLGGKAE
jgi:hypothetical protein